MQLKPLLIFALSLCFSIKLTGQTLVAYQFQTEPYLQASYVNNQLIASDISLSSGSIKTNKTTGSYFTNEPYVEGTSWKANSAEEAKYFLFQLTPKNNIVAHISEIRFEAYRTSSGPSSVAIQLGNQQSEVFALAAAKHQVISWKCQLELEQPTDIKILAWAGGAGSFRLDEIELLGTASQLPDKSAPLLDTLVIQSKRELKLSFSEALAKETAENTKNYVVDGLSVATARIDESTKQDVYLSFSSDFLDEKTYTVTVSQIMDLAQNTLSPTSHSFTYQRLKPLRFAVPDSNTVQLEFTLGVEKSTAENLGSYSLESLGQPTKAELSAEGKTIRLTFAKSLPANQSLTLQVALKDQYGQMCSFSDTVMYYRANFGDVVFNELLEDPTPAPAYLPAARYIELFNNTNQAISLRDWAVVKDGKAYLIEAGTIAPQGYLVLADEDECEQFEVFGPSLALNFGSLAAEQTLELRDNSGATIDRLHYTQAYYQDPEKTAGGWSLERLDTRNFCAEQSNWAASTNYKGGTPAQQNAVATVLTDTSAPELVRWSVVSSKELAFYFDKALDASASKQLTHYLLNEKTMASQADLSADGKQLNLLFSTHFALGKESLLTLSNITDRCQNTSSFQVQLNYQAIHVQHIERLSAAAFIVEFSEAPLAASVKAANFRLSPNIGTPFLCTALASQSHKVQLEFAQATESDVVYELEIDGIMDRFQQERVHETHSLFYHAVQPGELLINELLVYPNTGGVRFVELYNQSDYPIALRDVFVGREIGDTTELFQASTSDRTLPAHGLVALTKSTETLASHYNICEENVVKMPKLPAFNKDSDIIIIGDKSNTILDKFAYTPKLHFNMLTDKGRGFSLERLQAEQATNSPHNWQSASTAVGGATPGCPNSQFADAAAPSAPMRLQKDIFSPDADGKDDFLLIHYNLPEKEMAATLKVYDAKGRLVKFLANNQILGETGILKWDGTDEEGQLAELGIYIIWAEWYSETGERNTYKQACVLAADVN